MKKWLTKEQILFSKHIINGNLPHAILISGVKGSGKEDLANWLVQVIQCKQVILGEILQPCNTCKYCNLLLKKNYPDHSSVIAEKNLLGIDSIRKVSQFFEKTAQIGKIKSVLIPNAEKMTISAANALLKTLEEPTDNSVIILLTNERDTLLPTLISRCRLYEIRPPSGELLAQHISVNGDSNPFANLSHLPELSSHEIAEQYATFEQAFLSYLTQQEDIMLVTNLVSSSPYGLRWVEKVVVNAMRDVYGWRDSNLKVTPSLSNEISTNKKLNNKNLWHIYHKTIATISQCRTLSQINQQFMIEKLFVDIDNSLTNDQFKG